MFFFGFGRSYTDEPDSVRRPNESEAEEEKTLVCSIGETAKCSIIQYLHS
jgi:hypothetical protein